MLKEKSMTKNQEFCKDKLKFYMAKNNIKPYGNLERYEYGYKIWGEYQGKSRLYYVDKNIIKVWGGKRDKWQKPEYFVKVKEYKEPQEKIMTTKNGINRYHKDTEECAKNFGITRAYVVSMMNKGLKFRGHKIERILV